MSFFGGCALYPSHGPTRNILVSPVVTRLNDAPRHGCGHPVMTAHGLSDVIAPNLLHTDTPKGEFHIKTGGMMTGETTGVFGLKANGGFQNHALGLPNILGVIVLADAETGCTLAVLDSTEISRIHTGAATAVAARQLAETGQSHPCSGGHGSQAKTQIEALCQVLPIERVRLVGQDVHRTKHRASVIETQVGVAVEAVGDIGAATRHGDVVVTCTPARAPLLSSRTLHRAPLLQPWVQIAEQARVGCAADGTLHGCSRCAASMRTCG